ncbi:MAG: hypothetical protein AB7E47_15305 [Desulfovibrionaceae bacterium]
MLEDTGRFTREVVILGDDCPFDPVAEEALLYCASCGQQNVVGVSVDKDGGVIFQGFVCDHCGAWNGPE